jgi:exosome complex RNA-binding protein Rrp4
MNISNKPRQNRSTAYVREGSYICARCVDFGSSYDFSIGFRRAGQLIELGSCRAGQLIELGSCRAGQLIELGSCEAGQLNELGSWII